MIQVIDTHVHFWDTSRLRYPWLDDVDELGLPSQYGLADLLQAACGVELIGIVHVQAEMDHGVDPVLETAWVGSQLREAPHTDLSAVCIGYADLRNSDLLETVDAHQEYGYFRGIRQEIWFDPQSTRGDMPTVNYLEDPSWRRGFRSLGERGLLFEVLAWHTQLAQMGEVCAEAETSVILDHLALPGFARDLSSWERDVREFARAVPNSTVKLSGLGMNSAEFATTENEYAVRTAIEIFGPDRCMAASNFPVDSHAGSYGEYWELLHRWTADLSQAEQDQILRNTAARVYRIAV